MQTQLYGEIIQLYRELIKMVAVYCSHAVRIQAENAYF